ncbi:hypothetical protein LTR60_001066, partial [Cryomyces antarcticus]
AFRLRQHRSSAQRRRRQPAPAPGPDRSRRRTAPTAARPFPRRRAAAVRRRAAVHLRCQHRSPGARPPVPVSSGSTSLRLAGPLGLLATTTRRREQRRAGEKSARCEGGRGRVRGRGGAGGSLSWEGWAVGRLRRQGRGGAVRSI